MPELAVPARSEEELLAFVRARGPALVALSGGVDSAVVAALARSALGERVLAATVVSASVASGELDAARAVARALGLRHRLVDAEPLSDARYRENGADRCYRCRSVETRALREVGAREGLSQFLDGIQLDDLGDDRPGIRAMDEAGFLHPLLWAGWRKAEVRRYARQIGLPNADRPSNACLSSRVARGEPITAELLSRIDRAERWLLERGFGRVRVRVRGSSARIEVDRSEVDRLDEPGLRADLTARLAAIGFTSVAVDPRGYPARESLPTVP
jgi:pyridinium-3,5-biscarboxylic acid mononucleotide sulfurtransferase